MADAVLGRDMRGRRVLSSALDTGSSYNSVDSSGASTFHALRPAESRYSLREQFAVTRREIDFDFDTASILTRTTAASRFPHDGDDIDEFDETVGLSDSGISDGHLAKSAYPFIRLVSRGPYELLCLPKDPSLSPESITRAFNRLVQLLCVEKQPARFRNVASFYLGLAQSAYESLVKIHQTPRHDVLNPGELESCFDEDDEDDHLSARGYQECNPFEESLLLASQRAKAATDFGLRIDATPIFGWAHHARRREASLNLIDCSLGQSIAVDVPKLQRSLQCAASLLQKTVNRSISESKRDLTCGNSKLTVTGSAHGLLDEPFRRASLLTEPYQLPGPSLHGRRRLEQLVASRFLPGLNLSLRQELFWRDKSVGQQLEPSGARSLGDPDFVIEQELEILPYPSVAVRFGHTIGRAEHKKPLNVELSVQTRLGHGVGSLPSLGLALHRNIGPGTAFLVADAGDWSMRSSKECRELSKFSKAVGSFNTGQLVTGPFQNAPTVEVGYSFNNRRMGMNSSRAFTRSSDKRTRGMDCDLMGDDKSGSWTVSGGLTPGAGAVTYLRYSKDLTLLTTNTAKGQKTNDPSLSAECSGDGPDSGGFRAEAEWSGGTRQDFLVAFRALKRVGVFSNFGFEVGITPNNVHLSLYWSRLEQRISLPILVATKSSLINTNLVFWAVAFPFAVFAAAEGLLYRQRQRLRRQQTSVNALEGNGVDEGKRTNKPRPRKEDLQEYIVSRRAEADDLTVILATGVEPLQKAEAQKNGLVILGAKYGVQDAPPDEVADVTIAVAALVHDSDNDNGPKLVIPKGLRKSHLLGFWDPAPMNTKVLRVRYLYRGQEHAVEVIGRDELMLP